MNEMRLQTFNPQSGNMVGPPNSKIMEFSNNLASVNLTHLPSLPKSSNLPVNPVFNNSFANGLSFQPHHFPNLQGLAEANG